MKSFALQDFKGFPNSLKIDRFRSTTVSLCVLASVPFTSIAANAQSVSELTQKCDTIIGGQLRKTEKHPTLSGWTSTILKLNQPLTAEMEHTLRSTGADIYKRLPLIQSIAVRIPTAKLKQFAALPFVVRLSQDAVVIKDDAFTVGHSGAYQAWEFGDTGSGVTVAVVDSGIATHPDLNNSQSSNSGTRILASVNFSTDSSASDACGHGTHVAGIIAGNGTKSTGSRYFQTFYGIAPSANLVNVHVLNSQGQGTVSGVISGLTWVINNQNTYNIRVVNLSLGHPIGDSYKNDPLCQAVEAVYRSGITVVCAAGNGGRLNATQGNISDNQGYGTNYGSIQSPGNDPYVITVGAMEENANNPYSRTSDRIATYSSRGPSLIDLNLKPDIVAPGNRVISLDVPTGYLETTYGATNDVPLSAYVNNGSSTPSKQYFQLSGTSMATPVVSGAVALLLANNPSLTPDTVKARLMVSADKWTNANGTSDLCTYGAGYLDIPAALASNVVANTAALSPPLKLTSDGLNVIVDPNQVIWGGNGSGSTTDPWGSPQISSLSTIYGSGTQNGVLLVNGQSSLFNYLVNPSTLASATVWGDQVLWGGNGGTTPPPPAVDLSSIVLSGE